ncbi:MAG: hydroxymethylbilane synthase [Bdellovibrionia bacterium]
MNSLKLGTRKSLLAWAQSSWVAREIERLNPGATVELVGIETRGDRIQNVSLQQVAGKEFFVAELDDALSEGRVDLTVHSMKDLSLDRPEQFILGATPRRENPRDVVLFGPGVMEKLAAGKTLRIGTSSPRRIENIPPFLRKALPHLGGHSPSVDLVEIRGNVNTRLSRVHEPAGSERHLDAVVLAFAGLIRLWNDTQGRAELSKLLQGVRWMVLPLRECPAAPAQGALAVECRRDDQRVRSMLTKLHDEPSAKSAAMERQLLADWGGGCHQRFGATAVHSDKLGSMMWVRGVKPDNAFVEEFRWKNPAPASNASTSEVWDGSQWRAEAEKSDSDISWSADLSSQCVFISHARAVRGDHARSLKSARVWTSGTSSWFKLAAQGVWVEGCAELMGYEALKPTLGEAVLQLAPLNAWTVLTHESARGDWAQGQVIATYKVSARYSQEAKDALARAKYVFWSSGSQFDELHSLAPAGAQQACGLGKTADRLLTQAKTAGVQVFPSVEEWRKWVTNKASSH